MEISLTVKIIVAILLLIILWWLLAIRIPKLNKSNINEQQNLNNLNTKGFYAGYVPQWVKQKLMPDYIGIPVWTKYIHIEEVISYARGKSYEYILVVADVGHTHDEIILKRKIR